MVIREVTITASFQHILRAPAAQDGGRMSVNRGVVYLGPGKVEVQSIPYPKMHDPQGKQIDHGVILRVVSTNICGSDQHMVRGRTTAPEGLVLGHEITGEVVEIGRGVETMKIGDLFGAVQRRLWPLPHL